MGIIYGKPLMSGGQKPSQLNVTTNATWSKTGGYSPVNVNVPASAVTSGTKVITANGSYDVTEFKNVNANIPASAVTSGTKTIFANGVYDVTEFKNIRVRVGAARATISPLDGVSYTNGLPSDWSIMKEIGMAISEASDSINANTTGSVYVSKGNTWAYKITPGNTINITSQIGTHAYAVMGFNNFALTNQSNYGGTHSTAGLTFGAVDCVTTAKMNSNNTNSGGWGECLMRTSKMPTLQSGMPDTIAQVRVLYVGSDNSTILYSDDYMFLPAAKEVLGNRGFSPLKEGKALTQFAYYKNGGSKIKSFSGGAVIWWLRSVRYDTDAHFCSVSTAGTSSADAASNFFGAAPCFCV